jgi:hypothetical protein
MNSLQYPLVDEHLQDMGSFLNRSVKFDTLIRRSGPPRREQYLNEQKALHDQFRMCSHLFCERYRGAAHGTY